MRYINSFFNFIRSHFGCKICNLLKYCIKLFRLNVNLRLRIRFIRSCINLELLPKHLQNLLSDNVHFFTNSATCRFRRLNYTFATKALKLELQDAYKHLYHTRTRMFKICSDISNYLPISIANTFFRQQEMKMSWLWCSKIQKMVKRHSG